MKIKYAEVLLTARKNYNFYTIFYFLRRTKVDFGVTQSKDREINSLVQMYAYLYFYLQRERERGNKDTQRQ